MSRITENWEKVVRSVPCPICGAVKGAPCSNPYGKIFEGTGHSGRRDKYYVERRKAVTKGIAP